MAEPIAVIAQGLGTIGAMILRAAAADPAFRVVGAVDVAETMRGRDLADLVPGAPAGIVVQASLAEALQRAPGAALLLHAAGSALEQVAPHFADAVTRGLHVVSTCEKLAYPFHRHPQLSDYLDDLALRAGCTIVGTGVNPGFIMDQVVVLLAAASRDIRRVRVERVLDPRTRRPQFQRKVGLDLSRAEYDRLAARGLLGHVGLEESGRLVAAGLRWRIEECQESVEPLQPDPDGPLLGMRQSWEGRAADGRLIDLRFEANAAVDSGYDAIEIDGEPPLAVRFAGGVSGDGATAAAVLRAARVMPSAPRGLVTVLDLPLRRRPLRGAGR